MFSKLTQDHFLPLPYERKMAYLAKQKREGKRPGVPDFLLVIPAEATIDGVARIVFVEMKRQDATPCKVRKEQKVWLAALSQVEGVTAEWTKGAGAAKQVVGQFLNC